MNNNHSKTFKNTCDNENTNEIPQNIPDNPLDLGDTSGVDFDKFIFSRDKLGTLFRMLYSGNIPGYTLKMKNLIAFIEEARTLIKRSEIMPITPDKAITYQTEECEKLAYEFLSGLYQLHNSHFTYYSDKDHALKIAKKKGFDTLTEFQTKLEELIEKGSKLID
jgi:hypothetical protein